jgi:hypothetical protein
MGRNSASLGKVVGLDEGQYHNKSIVRLPGHDARMHSVVILRESDRLVVRCSVDAVHGFIPCDNGPKAVCYHALGALSLYASIRGYECAFALNDTNARKSKNFHQPGVKLVNIVDYRGRAGLVMIYWPKTSLLKAMKRQAEAEAKLIEAERYYVDLAEQEA